MYEFKIDLNGDAKEDITYRFTFGERDSAGTQAVELRRLTGPAAADHHAKGSLIAQGGTGQTISGHDGVRTPQTGD